MADLHEIANSGSERVKAEKDAGERRDLAREMPDIVKDLDLRLSRYLAMVNAQMPRPNVWR